MIQLYERPLLNCCSSARIKGAFSLKRLLSLCCHSIGYKTLSCIIYDGITGFYVQQRPHINANHHVKGGPYTVCLLAVVSPYTCTDAVCMWSPHDRAELDCIIIISERTDAARSCPQTAVLKHTAATTHGNSVHREETVCKTRAHVMHRL